MSAPPGASFADVAPAGGAKSAPGRTVRLDGSRWSVGFDLAGAAASSASVSGATASYSLGGGASLVEQAAPDGGVKESIRLAAAPVAPGDVSFSFALDANGVVPSVDSGQVVFKTPDGTVVASIPAGLAVDSATPAPTQSPLTTVLAGGPGAWMLKVTVSGAWLADKARVYPVAIDPSLQFGRGGSTAEADAFVYNGTPTTNYSGPGQYVPAFGNYVDAVGAQSGGQWATFMKWNLSALIGTGKGISSATLTMSVVAQNPSSGAPGYQVQALASDFSAIGVTWNNQPAPTAGNGEPLSAAATGGQVTTLLTNEATKWASGQLPTFSGWADVIISAPSFVNEASDFGAMSATGGVDPLLQITYTDLPAATITSPPTFNPCQAGDHSSYSQCYPVLGSTSPTVTLTQPGNPAGHTVSYWYQITDGGNSTTIPANGDYGVVVQSGWVAGLSWTPPPGSLVDGGQYFLYVYTQVDGVSDAPAQGVFNVRLPRAAVTPTDSSGPISLNMATGSPTVSLASQAFQASSGAIGLGFVYDPQRATGGLQGNYYNNCNGTTNPWPTVPTMSRNDPVVSFYWGNDAVWGSPSPGLVNPGSYCAQWTGFLTVPYSGTWQVGALGVGDGIAIQLGSATVLNDWADHSAANEFCTGSSVCNQTLTGGTSYPVTVNYYHHLSVAQIELAVKGPINPDGSAAPGQLNEVAVPAPWLTLPTRALPAGWQLKTLTGVAAYSSAAATSQGETLTPLAGPALAYTATGSTYLPPNGETASLKWVTDNGAKVLKVADRQVTYGFDVAGKLLSTVTGADLTTPTSPQYGYNAGGQETRVTDPVSGRHLDITYGTRTGGSDPNCHVSATGFDPDPPVGVVCKVTFPDGSTDALYYSAGQLSRLVTSIPSGSMNPFGGNITDMGYDAQSRLVSTRTPLGADQVAAGLAAADTTSATVIAYDPTSGKATTVTAPKAQATATTQVTHTYAFTSATETRLHVAGFTEPSGAPWARKVTFDSNGRLTGDTDPAALSTATAYDTFDQPILVTTPAGLRTSTFYDVEGKPTDTYGPAATNLFDATDHPGSGNTARVPHTVTGYDEGLHGLAVSYYNGTALAGAPLAQGLTIGKGGNDFYNTYPASPAPGVAATNWSARLTGRITWPVTGNYTVNIASAGGAQLWVDGVLEADAGLPAHSLTWTTGFSIGEFAGKTSLILIEYYNTTYSPGVVALGWSGSQSGDIPTSALNPDLGLVTSTTDADGHKTATEYARPELGTVSATVVDPAGLALRTTHASDGLLRQSGQRLPANSYPQAVRADNPAGYWRLDDHTYETLADASGHNLTGAYSGAGVTLAQPSALVADDNPSATFNGTTGTATVADNTTLRFDRTQAFSIEAWVNTTSSADMAVASKMANAAPYAGWDLSLDAGKPYLQLINTWTTSTLERAGSVNLADGHWHHLVATYDGTSRAAGVNFYEDGTLDAAPATVYDTLTTSPVSTVAVTVGSRAASGEWFAGAIDDVAVYPTPLSAARIAAHAKAGNSKSAAVTTAYYSTGDTAPTNGCGATAIVGLAKQTTDADPDGAGPAQPIAHQAVYDTLGRPTGREIVGDANWSCVGYDTRGRPATGTDSAGHQITDNYNDTTTPGTLTQSYTDSGGAARTVTAVTDLTGRSISYTDEQGGTTTAVYDQVGRLSDTYRGVFGGAQTHLTNTDYDNFGRPSTNSEYLSGTARTTTTTYDAQGRPQVTTLPNGVATTNNYNTDLGYLAGLTNITAGGTHLSDWTYQQTLGGQINTDTNTSVRTRTYTYDQAGRLTQTVQGTTTRSYAYDPNTNRCALAAACDGTWTYNPADQLTASPQATSYTYDTHGQLTAATRVDGKTEIVGYDANDHATTIDDGTTTVAETLAPGGRVLERKVTNDATHAMTEDTLYGYSGSSDSPTYTRPAAGGAVTSYVGACVDVAGTATWEIRNGHSDVVGTTDNASIYTANPTTDEFGVGNTPASRLGYLGGAARFTVDATLGIIRMGARLYDPTLGRFLQVDPVAGGSANGYDYVNQNPVNGFDLGGTILCTDDFCGTVQAFEARSRALDYAKDQMDLKRVDSLPLPPNSTAWRAAKDTVKVLGGAAAGVFAAGVLLGTAPEDLKVLSGIDTAFAAAGAIGSCVDNGPISLSCGAGFADVTVSAITGGLAITGKERATQVAAATIGAAWTAFSSWAGF